MITIPQHVQKLARACHPISREAEIELGKKAQEGCQMAKGQLVKSHIRFAVKEAYRYASKFTFLDFESLYGEFLYIMVQKADTYNPEFRFCTYLKNSFFIEAMKQKHKAMRVTHVEYCDEMPAQTNTKPMDFAAIQPRLLRLSADEVRIVCLYYGLNSEAHTLEELAEIFGISFQAVQKKLKLAVEKMK